MIPYGPPLDDVLAARLDADDDLDDGWTHTVIVEPLTALAGGILGGILIGALAWRGAWSHADRRARAGGYVPPKARR